MQAAFRSLPRSAESLRLSHHAFFTALEEGGCHIAYLESIRDMYTSQATTFPYRGKTDNVRVHVQRGIKQCDPLHPFLFILTMDALLNDLSSSTFGYAINGQAIAAMAYADDLLFVASSYKELH